MGIDAEFLYIEHKARDRTTGDNDLRPGEKPSDWIRRITCNADDVHAEQ